MGHRLIPVHAAVEGGCGSCLSSSQGPVCRAEFGQACGDPVLIGPADKLHEVMAALSDCLAPVAAQQVVQTLRLADGEAELTLAVAGGCRNAEQLDAAFQTLRRLLPDTDIYVTPAR